MRMPQHPPPLDHLLSSMSPERLSELMVANAEAAYSSKYFHWNDIRVRTPPQGYSREEWWTATKLRRMFVRRELPFVDKSGQAFSYGDSGNLYRRLREVDRDASGQIETPSADGVHSRFRERYLISSLIEEAITSSQLEGAATTRLVAKEMLRSGRLPRDESEQMIVNNYHAMEFLRNHNGEELTVETLLELHSILTYKTLADHHVGRFRLASDEVDVAAWDGTVVHLPPDADELDDRINRLLAFANETDDGQNLHPFVRAVVLHFMVGYDHPFVDGNGRTARGLFYWSMAKSNYWLTEYLSISTIIRKAPSQYVRAYVYSGTDGGDVTYFLDYNLRVMVQAIRALHSNLARKSNEMEKLWQVIRGSDFASALNHRQIALLGHLLKYPEWIYSIAGHQRSHNVSYQTARTDLIDLAEVGLLEVSKRGRQLVYRRSSVFEDNLRGLEDRMKRYLEEVRA